MPSNFKAQQMTLSRNCVTAYCHMQFSGSSGSVANFSGSGFSGCYLSGTTYTLVATHPYPQLVGLQAQMALSPTYGSTPTVVFNGAQLTQFRSQTTGSRQSTGSGATQTIDFTVQNNGTPTVVPYGAGANWLFIEAVYVDNTRGKG